MDGLRPRERKKFSGFTKNEEEKMESLLGAGKELLNKEFCQKLALSFNRSAGRAGKPVVKWIQVQIWYRNRLQLWPFKVTAPYDSSKLPGSLLPLKARDGTPIPKGEKATDFTNMEFEARSSKDGAWYDVAGFLAYRLRSSGEPEAFVRFVGFGAEEDEWVSVSTAVRFRSIPLENSECHKVKAGDLVLCFQEKRDQAIYYDAHVIEVQRKMHDIRGCRCLFFIRYNHDNTEEKVRLKRLCYRPIN